MRVSAPNLPVPDSKSPVANDTKLTGSAWIQAFMKIAAKLPLSFPVPNGAFYAFIKIETPKWKKDLAFVHAALKEGVVFVPGSGFGRQEDGVYFRTTFLPAPHIIEEAFGKIKRIL